MWLDVRTDGTFDDGIGLNGGTVWFADQYCILILLEAQFLLHHLQRHQYPHQHRQDTHQHRPLRLIHLLPLIHHIPQMGTTFLITNNPFIINYSSGQAFAIQSLNPTSTITFTVTSGLLNGTGSVNASNTNGIFQILPTTNGTLLITTSGAYPFQSTLTVCTRIIFHTVFFLVTP